MMGPLVGALAMLAFLAGGVTFDKTRYKVTPTGVAANTTLVSCSATTWSTALRIDFTHYNLSEVVNAGKGEDFAPYTNHSEDATAGIDPFKGSQTLATLELTLEGRATRRPPPFWAMVRQTFREKSLYFFHDCEGVSSSTARVGSQKDANRKCLEFKEAASASDPSCYNLAPAPSRYNLVRKVCTKKKRLKGAR